MELKTDRIRVSLQQLQMEAQNQILVQSSLFYAEQKMLEQMRAKVHRCVRMQDRHIPY